MSNFKLESYPPEFHQLITSNRTQTLDFDMHNSHKPVLHSDPIPVIDLDCLSVEKLIEVCQDWGVFRLVNHGIPSSLLSEVHDQVDMLFSIPFESKQAGFPDSPITYFWGTPVLTPSGAAVSRGSQNTDWVEGFNIPVGQLSQYQPNDSAFDAFRLQLDEYGNHMHRIATTLFKSMTKCLHLVSECEPEFYVSKSTGSIRIYRYPHCSQGSVTRGMEVHTDSSVISILNQDEVSGLEVLKDDEWVHVNPIPDTLIVNLGDMMQAISNDKYKSVKHRVVTNKSKERISICYFVFPGEDAVIKSSKYKPFTYNEFRAQVQKDVKALGYKVGLDRFQL